MIEVTAAVIRRNGHFLICRRPEGKSCAGLWEFPGGKVETGETGEDCIRRECMEELELRLTVEQELTDIVKAYPEKTVHLHFFLCRISDNEEPVLKEHSACAWITPDKVPEYTFCPADKEMLESKAWAEFIPTL